MAVFTRLNGESTASRLPDPISISTIPPPLPVKPVEAAAPSLISRDLTIIGQQLTIITKGVLQVDGVIQGDLRGQEIIIGEHGRVAGTIAAEKVQVKGEVAGAIRGLAVTLHPSARVEGEIHHQSLTIAEGAAFDGRVRRPKDAAELQPQLDTDEPPQAVAA